eukprot:1166455-Amphidinium_carterae.1
METMLCKTALERNRELLDIAATPQALERLRIAEVNSLEGAFWTHLSVCPHHYRAQTHHSAPIAMWTRCVGAMLVLYGSDIKHLGKPHMLQTAMLPHIKLQQVFMESPFSNVTLTSLYTELSGDVSTWRLQIFSYNATSSCSVNAIYGLQYYHDTTPTPAGHADSGPDGTGSSVEA